MSGSNTHREKWCMLGFGSSENYTLHLYILLWAFVSHTDSCKKDGFANM